MRISGKRLFSRYIAFYEIQLFLFLVLLFINRLFLFNPFFIVSQGLLLLILIFIVRYRENVDVKSKVRNTVWIFSLVVTVGAIVSLMHLSYGDINISSESGFKKIRWNLNGTYVLSRNIDMSFEYDDESCVVERFNGIFDGKNHQISNSKTSLFCEIGIEGVVQDISFINLNIVIDNSLSKAPIAIDNRGKISNVSIVGVIDSEGDASGIVKFNYGIIEYVKFEGSITAIDFAGGIAVKNSGIITNSSVIGTIQSDYLAGGIVAVIIQGDILDCLSDVNITSPTVGGIAGHGIFVGDMTLDGFVIKGDLTGESVAVVMINDFIYDYSVLYMGTIDSEAYEIETDVLYTENQLFIVTEDNFIDLTLVDSNYYINVLGLTLEHWNVVNLGTPILKQINE